MFRHILFGFILSLGTINVMAESVNLEKMVNTRYGKLSVNHGDNGSYLLFKDKRVLPSIAGNNGLYLEKVFQMADKDIALIYDSGGAVCPATYYFLTISSNKIQATPAFGTCASAISFQKEKNQDLTVVIPGFIAMTENVSPKELKRIDQSKNKYTFKDGIVYLNGKALTEDEFYLDGKKVK